MEAVRQFLKQETFGEHLRVDKSMSQLNLAERDGLIHFLCIHNVALRAIDAAWEIADLLDVRALINLTEQDLSVLDALPPKVAEQDVQYAEPLGPAYVLAGSHFGKGLMQRRWNTTRDSQVRLAGAFLEADILNQSWHPVMSHLADIPITSRTRIAAAARRTFNIYYSAIQECLSGPGQSSLGRSSEKPYGSR